MSAARYPIATLTQMAKIPDEALPRFLAELPAILTSLRQMDAAAETLAQEARSKAPWWMRWLVTPRFIRLSLANSANMAWIDDDNGNATVSFQWSENQPKFYSRTEKMEARK